MQKRKGYNTNFQYTKKQKSEKHNTAEHIRIKDRVDWLKWGPYLSERQWGTVREDKSLDGNCWNYFPFEDAIWRSYEHGEDGLFGFSDDQQILCLSLALWNGKDAFLKERLFGLTNPQGNHGEDVKEVYFYLDSTPTHSYMKALYIYPHLSFPYETLITQNQKLTKMQDEFEIYDTDIFDNTNYSEIYFEVSKANSNDILFQYTINNKSKLQQKLHILPTIFFRNTWSHDVNTKPNLSYFSNNSIFFELFGEKYHFVGNPAASYCKHFEMVFTENESNLSKQASEHKIRNIKSEFYKDGINEYIINGSNESINGSMIGTKASFIYTLDLPPLATSVIQCRLMLIKLCDTLEDAFATNFTNIFRTRKQEADLFYSDIIPPHIDYNLKTIIRQAYAGLCWNKQYYQFNNCNILKPQTLLSNFKHLNKEYLINPEELLDIPSSKNDDICKLAICCPSSKTTQTSNKLSIESFDNLTNKCDSTLKELYYSNKICTTDSDFKTLFDGSKIKDYSMIPLSSNLKNDSMIQPINQSLLEEMHSGEILPMIDDHCIDSFIDVSQSDYNICKLQDLAEPKTSKKVVSIRNEGWEHLNCHHIIIMPDKWEFPWFAMWDVAFHAVVFADLDAHFAAQQLLLFMTDDYQRISGQMPAYEFEFGDVNPPLHAWACFKVSEKFSNQTDAISFLHQSFPKLELNFNWWLEKMSVGNVGLFGGGFLGMDNISCFDRSHLPFDCTLEQADGTCWMAFFALYMLKIALKLVSLDKAYDEKAMAYLLRFKQISADINHNIQGLWHSSDGFFYDRLTDAKGDANICKIKSLVGIISLFATASFNLNDHMSAPLFLKTLKELELNDWKNNSSEIIISLVSSFQLKQILEYLFSEKEFLSKFGIRSLSKFYEDNMYKMIINNKEYNLKYEAGQSSSSFYGGNSNWRGPIWICMNYLIIESLNEFHQYIGSSCKYEYPTDSNNYLTLFQIIKDLQLRILQLFLANHLENTSAYKHEFLKNYKDCNLFYEFYNAETGAGCGASHQTGWTSLIAVIIKNLQENKSDSHFML